MKIPLQKIMFTIVFPQEVDSLVGQLTNAPEMTVDTFRQHAGVALLETLEWMETL